MANADLRLTKSIENVAERLYRKNLVLNHYMKGICVFIKAYLKKLETKYDQTLWLEIFIYLRSINILCAISASGDSLISSNLICAY